MKLQIWSCANGCGEWATEVPDCFQYNGAEVFCTICTITNNFAQAMAAAFAANV